MTCNMLVSLFFFSLIVLPGIINISLLRAFRPEQSDGLEVILYYVFPCISLIILPVLSLWLLYDITKTGCMRHITQRRAVPAGRYSYREQTHCVLCKSKVR